MNKKTKSTTPVLFAETSWEPDDDYWKYDHPEGDRVTWPGLLFAVPICAAFWMHDAWAFWKGRLLALVGKDKSCA
jgi:hypothetical protein